MLAAKAGKPLPTIERAEAARRRARPAQLAGRYRERRPVARPDRDATAGCVLTRTAAAFRVELRKRGDGPRSPTTCSACGHEDRRATATSSRSARRRLRRRSRPRPAAEPPAKWHGLIGEYGWDHNTLYILEKDGKLHALIEWFFLYPLDGGVGERLRVPGRLRPVPRREAGLHPRRDRPGDEGRGGERRRSSAGKIDGEDGETFRIKPQRPVDELRKEALAAKPPEEDGEFRKPDLVDLATLDPTIKLDIRYATDNNFLEHAVLHVGEGVPAAARRPRRWCRVHKKLAEQGYGLLIHDAYRPWYVTKMFWDATPEKFRNFVADPAKGSRHNRGCAVDLTLYDLKTGKPVEMVGGYDEFSDRSYPGLPRRHVAAALAPRPAAAGDGGGGLHRLRGGVVALRLQGLAEVPDPEQARSRSWAGSDRPCEQGRRPGYQQGERGA